MISTNPQSLVGKTLTHLTEDGFSTSDGKNYSFHHDQDCCEIVEHFDTIGNYTDVLNKPIIEFTDKGETHPDHGGHYMDDSHTWTTYTIIVEGGACVKIYFLGESNGYYGETMEIYERINPSKP